MHIDRIMPATRVTYDVPLDGLREAAVSGENLTEEVRIVFYRVDKDGESQENTIRISPNTARILANALMVSAKFAEGNVLPND